MKTFYSVADSYRCVRRISRRSGSNFYRSFWLLPKEKRQAMYALYAFARITDDLGDCDEPAALRTRWLDWWRQTTALNLISESSGSRLLLPDGPFPGGPFPGESSGRSQPARKSTPDLHQSAHQIMPALRDASARFNIPSRYLLEIIDGVIADQSKTRFDTYEQVEHYCYLVASAVGLACLHVWEFEHPLPEAAAIDCGLAFQLTNILRDISEDARRGRIYLPRQHYEQHGLSEDDLLQPRPDDRLECLISEEAKRAEQLFVSGWEVWDSISSDGKPMFSMMWRTYRKLLQRIIEAPGMSVVRRIELSTSEKWGLVSRHFFPAMFRRLPVPPIEVLEGASSDSRHHLSG